jgi:hypothetical protein
MTCQIIIERHFINKAPSITSNSHRFCDYFLHCSIFGTIFSIILRIILEQQNAPTSPQPTRPHIVVGCALPQIASLTFPIPFPRRIKVCRVRSFSQTAAIIESNQLLRLKPLQRNILGELIRLLTS